MVAWLGLLYLNWSIGTSLTKRTRKMSKMIANLLVSALVYAGGAEVKNSGVVELKEDSISVLNEKVEALKEIVQKTDTVRIVSHDTTFLTKKIKVPFEVVKPCDPCQDCPPCNPIHDTVWQHYHIHTK